MGRSGAALGAAQSTGGSRSYRLKLSPVQLKGACQHPSNCPQLCGHRYSDFPALPVIEHPRCCRGSWDSARLLVALMDLELWVCKLLLLLG